MTATDIINDKTLKAKAKVQILGSALLNKSIAASEILRFAKSTTETNTATCLEALEFATKQQPAIANNDVFEFATNSLTDTAPRIKWKGAKR